MPLLTTQSAKGYGFGKYVSTAAVTGDYESIATYSLSSSQATITFSSIPNTYKHLELRVVGRSLYASSDYDGIWIRFNNSSSSNYYWVNGISYNGNNLSQGQGNAKTYFENVGFQANDNLTSYIFAPNLLTIWDYTNTSKGKQALLSSNGKKDSTAGYNGMTGLYWNDTSAIDRIDLEVRTPSTYNWKTGSHFALYGIKG